MLEAATEAKTGAGVAGPLLAAAGGAVAKPRAQAATVTATAVATGSFRPNVRRVRRVPWTPISFFLFVLVPTFALGAFWFAVASPRYESEFRVAVRSTEPLKSVAMPAILGLAGNSQTTNDSQAVVQYLQSREPVDELDNRIGLRGLYTADTIDWWSRLGDKEPIEGVVRYWRNYVDAYFETSTGTIIVRTKAFSPQAAFDIARQLKQLSEALVNRMSERSRADAVAFAEQAVKGAEARLAAASAKIRELRDSQNILDPRETAKSSAELAAKIAAEISELNVQIADQRKNLGDDAPSVKSNLDRLDSLKRELKAVGSTVTSSDQSSKPLSSVIGAFERLDGENQFAERAYQGAMAALEAARMEAARQQIYLATIVEAAKPQEPVYPRPMRDTLVAFVGFFALWGMGLLAVRAIREHV